MAGKSKKDSQNEQLTLSDVEPVQTVKSQGISPRPSGNRKSASKKSQGEMLADIPESLADLSASDVLAKDRGDGKSGGKVISALSKQDKGPAQLKDKEDSLSKVEDAQEIADVENEPSKSQKAKKTATIRQKKREKFLSRVILRSKWKKSTSKTTKKKRIKNRRRQNSPR